MLKKLRLKFALITTAITTALLLAVLAYLLLSTANNMEQRSLQGLRETASAPLPPDEHKKQPHKPYFTLEYGPDGPLVIYGKRSFALNDPEYLQSIWDQVTQTDAVTGVLDSYGLRYYRTAGMQSEAIFFTDISDDQQILRNLLVNCLIIGAGGFLCLLGLSFLLAHWAVKPVEQAWLEQRQFIADASHELKTPLTVITTSTELLAQEEAGDPQRDRLLRNIQLMSQQMRALIESLLELARLDNGAVRNTFQQVDLSSTVSDASLLFEPVLYEAGLALDVRITPGITVRGSRDHLRRVAESLLDNAVKYAQPGAPVTVTLEKSGHRECLLRLSNACEDLSSADLENIFLRFYRIDKPRTDRDSYGLGLSIIRSIAEAHGGKAWAESKEGRVTFCVRLPMIAQEK